jgi:hypothetical protein
MLVRRWMVWDTSRVTLVRRLRVLCGVHSAAAAAIILKTWTERRKDEKERMSE